MAYCGHGVSISNYSGCLVRELLTNKLMADANALGPAALPSALRITVDIFQSNRDRCLAAEAVLQPRPPTTVTLGTSSAAILVDLRPFVRHSGARHVFPPIPGGPLRTGVAWLYLHVLAMADRADELWALGLWAMLVMPWQRFRLLIRCMGLLLLTVAVFLFLSVVLSSI